MHSVQNKNNNNTFVCLFHCYSKECLLSISKFIVMSMNRRIKDRMMLIIQLRVNM